MQAFSLLLHVVLQPPKQAFLPQHVVPLLLLPLVLASPLRRAFALPDAVFLVLNVAPTQPSACWLALPLLFVSLLPQWQFFSIQFVFRVQQSSISPVLMHSFIHFAK